MRLCIRSEPSAPDDARDLRILDAVDDGEDWATIAGREGVSLKHIDDLVNATLEGEQDG